MPNGAYNIQELLVEFTIRGFEAKQLTQGLKNAKITNDCPDQASDHGILVCVLNVMDVLPPTWKNENKRLIKQLVMRETFSREECDELTKIIESRVTNWIAESVNNTAKTTPDVPTAIMEAKKWLQEKKFGSGSNLKLEHDALPYVIKGWLGSPVDVAKSYMQDRPAWASPTLRHIEFKTTSPMGPQHSKDEMPITIFGNSLQPSQIQRSSVASGSWNILEEVQKEGKANWVVKDKVGAVTTTDASVSSKQFDERLTLGNTTFSPGQGTMTANPQLDGEICLFI
ncbi:hypothetical protein Nepgr_001031 [Nepenthes gracilis]|uniref:Uncharacterized protein n=1 Tax=Nepenthes gracilis TaxID=150966 RepID=A0AAD3RVT8_NEPGR|nr:hypothetical protein Nepgr_001031 [Nepenthes gracilis]